MLEKGNGDPGICAGNLLKIRRGEIPYDRLRGRSGPDRPVDEDMGLEEIEWLLETYEPRVEIEDVEQAADDIQTGDISTMVRIKRKTEDVDDE